MSSIYKRKMKKRSLRKRSIAALTRLAKKGRARCLGKFPKSKKSRINRLLSPYNVDVFYFTPYEFLFLDYSSIIIFL
jgi:hypothetical protein